MSELQSTADEARWTEELERLQVSLGHRFEDPTLLRRALTHRSYSHERSASHGRRVTDHYERMEFLGDSVLSLVSARWLFDQYPDEPEGELAKSKSFLVSTPVLAGFSKALGLGDLLRLGVGEDRSGGRSKESILADAAEAVFGALYLDGGLEAARRVILPMLEGGRAVRARVRHTDAKTLLQEESQARGWGLPGYPVVAGGGPDHEKTFRVECSVAEQGRFVAEGRSKKEAAQRAASAALRDLDLLDSDP